MRQENRHERIDGLVAALGCRDQRAALRAERRLIKAGAQAVDALMRAAASDDARVRFRAVWALGKIGDDRAVPVVVRLTGDSDARVAYDAALALEDLGQMTPRGGVMRDFSAPASKQGGNETRLP